MPVARPPHPAIRLPRVSFAARTACGPTWRWENPEGHRPCLNLWLIVDGRGTWTSRGQHYRLSAGDCFVQRLWHECRGTTDPADPLVVLWANLLLSEADGQPCDLVSLDDAELPALYRRVADLGFIAMLSQRLIDRFDSHGPGAACNQWAACLWQELSQPGAADEVADGDLTGVMAEVLAQPERPWRVAGLAAQAGMPVDRFTRRFRARTGLTPREFLMRARLDQAKAALRMSSLSIGEIAARFGFCDIYHFSRRFRRHVGCAPTAYRAGTL